MFQRAVVATEFAEEKLKRLWLSLRLKQIKAACWKRSSGFDKQMAQFIALLVDMPLNDHLEAQISAMATVLLSKLITWQQNKASSEGEEEEEEERRR